MSNFLINCSNLKTGGGLQVAVSVCSELKNYKQHRFIIVLSPYINDRLIEDSENLNVFRYDLPHDFKNVVIGRDGYLDSLVAENDVQAVLTIFGPSLWRPTIPHLCGFARAQLILKDSPYCQQRSWKEKLVHRIWGWAFRRSSKIFYTENHYISDILQKELSNVKVYTVSNYYNQIFDRPESWKRSIKLPPFEGVTCLSVSTNSSHKNFPIIIEVVRALREEHPAFNVRFVLTFNPEELRVPDDVKNNILFVGKVDVNEVPFLYEQADIMFMPTLLECFTATYPEAMRMEVPIVTTDLEFARGLCGNAACYYSAVDAQAGAEAVYKVATDKEYAMQLVAHGREQLKKFDTYEQRAAKLIRILEEISTEGR